MGSASKRWLSKCLGFGFSGTQHFKIWFEGMLGLAFLFKGLGLRELTVMGFRLGGWRTKPQTLSPLFRDGARKLSWNMSSLCLLKRDFSSSGLHVKSAMHQKHQSDPNILKDSCRRACHHQHFSDTCSPEKEHRQAGQKRLRKRCVSITN